MATLIRGPELTESPAEYQLRLMDRMDAEPEVIRGGGPDHGRMSDTMPEVHRWWKLKREAMAATNDPQQVEQAIRDGDAIHHAGEMDLQRLTEIYRKARR